MASSDRTRSLEKALHGRSLSEMTPREYLVSLLDPLEFMASSSETKGLDKIGQEFRKIAEAITNQIDSENALKCEAKSIFNQIGFDDEMSIEEIVLCLKLLQIKSSYLGERAISQAIESVANEFRPVGLSH